MLNTVGLFTNINYVSGFIEMFEKEGFHVSFEACTDMLPNWLSQLRVWDAKGIDIAIIDDQYITDKEAMVEGVTTFMNTTRPENGHMRIIFFSGNDRTHDDPVFARLAHAGIYDFIIPQQDTRADIDNFFTLVRAPRRRDQVITYINAYEPEEPKSYFRQRGKYTIAVASFVPRAGVTTTAFTLARSIILTHQRHGRTGKAMPLVAVGVSEEFFNSLAFGYMGKFKPEYGFYKINEMFIFNAMSSREIPRCDYVVLDLGQLDLEKSFGENAGNERFRSFLDADLKVVCIPYTNYIEAQNAQRLLAMIDPKTLSSYHLAFWGIRDDIFSKLKAGLAEHSPNCYAWKMPVSLWPIDSEILDAATLEAMHDVLPAKLRRIDNLESDQEAVQLTEQDEKKRPRFFHRKG